MSDASRRAAPRRAAWAVPGLLLAAVVALLVWLNSGSSWRAGPAAPGLAPAARQQLRTACRHWAAVDRLGGCIAEFAPVPPLVFQCCKHPHGANYTCTDCAPALLHHVACLASRQSLLRLPHGCTGPALPFPPPPAPPLPPAGPRGCPMSAADVAAGKWLPTANTSAAGMPSIPLLVFQLPDTHNGSSSSSNSGADGAAGADSSAGGSEASSSSSGGSQTCRQRRLGAAEVPGCLWAAGFDRVVVSGDSTIRMLWNRLHYLVRQSPVSFDAAASMTHGHYVLELHDSSPTGGTAGDSTAGTSSGSSSGSAAGGAVFAIDSLWFAPPGNVRPQVFNDSVMMDGLQHLINRTGAAGRGAGGGGSGGIYSSGSGGIHSSSSGSSRRLTLDFLVGSTSAWQQRHVRQYVASDMGDDASWRQRTLLVLSLCIWEGKDVRPAGWFEFMEEMRQQVAQVVLLTCPTERFGVPDRFATRRVVAQRNEVLRQMVADSRGGSVPSGASGSGSAGSGTAAGGSSGGSSGRSGSGRSSGADPNLFLLLDLDAMTKWLPREVALSPHDFHYQCYPVTQSAYTVGSLEWAGGDGSPLPLYPPRKLSHLNIAANGWCADPVDYSAWQLLFHMLCPRQAGE